MKTTTQSATAAIRMAVGKHPHKGQARWQSPRHRPLPDRTLQVCDHLETFQPERWRRAKRWGQTESSNDRTENVRRNRIIRRAEKLAAKQDWRGYALMLRQHDWLAGTIH
jgi:hypothetical protein